MRMPIDAMGVALPDLDDGTGDRLGGDIDNPAADVRDLTHRLRRLAPDLYEIRIHVTVPLDGIERSLGLARSCDQLDLGEAYRRR